MTLTTQKVLRSILAAIAPVAWAQADLRGVYVYTNDVSQISKAAASQLTQAFNIPGVDGIAVVIGWDAIEPQMGQYQWTLLDQWISQAIALGKKIDLVVPAGSSTPLLVIPIASRWRRRDATQLHGFSSCGRDWRL